MGTESSFGSDRLELLEFAAAMHGPKEEPPYVRSAFPLITLPVVLREFVTESAEAIGVAPEVVALPALATCATAIGNTCRIQLAPRWTEPCVIWGVTLMKSGSLKTPAYNLAREPLRAAQILAVKQFVEQQQDYRKAKLLFEAESSAWKTPTEGYRGETPPSEPVAPTPVDYYTSDSTVEALAMLFEKNPRGLALTRDELSGFFGSFGAYKGGRGADESNYLEFYQAGEVKLNRAGGKRIYVPNAALSIFGTCQPAVFLNAIGMGKTTNQIENGLAARFLITAPERMPKRLRKEEPKENPEYHHLIQQLLTIPLPRTEDGRVDPVIIKLAPRAENCFERFVEEHDQQVHAIINPALQFHYAKLEAVAARFALIFYMCDLGTNQLHGASLKDVQEQHVLAGIALARWFGREACRVYEGLGSQSEQEKSELIDLIRDQGGDISASEMRTLKRVWRESDVAEAALRGLERDGFGKMYQRLAVGNGSKACLRFRLHDQPLSQTPPEIAENRGVCDN